MKPSSRHFLPATVLICGLIAALPPTSGRADDDGHRVDLANGQINRGYDPKNPTTEISRPIPTFAEAQAVIMMADEAQPSVGPQAADPMPPSDNMRQETKDGQATAGGPQATNAGSDAMRNGTGGNSGKAAPSPATTGTSGTAAKQPAGQQADNTMGPIGATGQTMPSKLSQRNDVLDRMPVMAMPMKLSDSDRQRIYQTVMADKSQPASSAEKLAPADFLSTEQAANDMHPLPGDLQQIGLLKGLSFVKAKDKVLLVEPATRVVMEEIKA